MHNSYVKSDNRWQSKRSKNITSNLLNDSENALIGAQTTPHFPLPTFNSHCSPLSAHLHISMHAIRRVEDEGDFEEGSGATNTRLPTVTT